MSYDIYLCGNCLMPMWFPYGEKMHLGTGWDCWHNEQTRTGPFADLVDFWFDTNPSLLEGLVERAVEYYTAWNPDDAKARARSPLIPFLRKQLAAGRGDVMYRFFQHVARGPRKKASAIVRDITRTPQWTRFVKRAVERHRRRS